MIVDSARTSPEPWCRRELERLTTSRPMCCDADEMDFRGCNEDLRVEVWMRNDNHLEAAQSLNPVNRFFVEICHQIPENISMRCLYQSCTLSDAKLCTGSVAPSMPDWGAPTFGSVHISHTCSSRSTCSNTFLYFFLFPSALFADLILPRVVHVCPVEGTNCRGSYDGRYQPIFFSSQRLAAPLTSHIRHSSIPTSSVTSYCAPQAPHMIRSSLVLNTGMLASVFRLFACGEVSDPAEPMMASHKLSDV